MTNQSLQLLEQIIEMAQGQEAELNSYRLANHKAALTVGESALLHHLKLLRELLAKGDNIPATVTFKDKTFTVSYGLAPAFKDGFDAALLGRMVSDCPYAPDTPQSIEWIHGHGAGSESATM